MYLEMLRSFVEMQLDIASTTGCNNVSQPERVNTLHVLHEATQHVSCSTQNGQYVTRARSRRSSQSIVCFYGKASLIGYRFFACDKKCANHFP